MNVSTDAAERLQLIEQRAASDVSPEKDTVANIKMKSTGAEATTSSGDQQAGTDVPSRASFLGLPAEMRLRIYDFLLDASRRPASEVYRDTRKEWHCCTLPDEHRLICGCAKTIYTSILRVSKFINQEATPVLYSSIEARVEAHIQNAGTEAHYDLTRMWRLPLSDDAHMALITSLVFATAMSAALRVSFGNKFYDRLKPLWSDLNSRLCNLKNVRFHFLMDSDVHYEIFDDDFDYEGFLGMLALPKLQKLTLEVFVPYMLCPQDSYGPERHEEAVECLSKLEQKARTNIDKLGKIVEVVGVVRQQKCMEHDRDSGYGLSSSTYEDEATDESDVADDSDSAVADGTDDQDGDSVVDEVAGEDGNAELLILPGE